MNKSFMHFLRDKKGFTLLETAVAVSLAILIIIAAVDISWRIWGAVNNSKERFNEQTELHNAIYWVTSDLRSANFVEVSGPSRLKMESKGMEITYYTDAGNLIRDCNGSKKTVARNIKEASFQLYNKDSGVLVSIQFKSSEKGVRTCLWVYTK